MKSYLWRWSVGRPHKGAYTNTLVRYAMRETSVIRLRHRVLAFVKAGAATINVATTQAGRQAGRQDTRTVRR